MELYLGIAAISIVLAVIFKGILSGASGNRKPFTKHTYFYTAKPLLMTPAETTFFRTLEKAVADRYYVFPQIHLSALLDYRAKGQNWHAAFKHINGKSVDYVLCDRNSLRPVYAIELDDYTHTRPDRQERDSEVQRIFEQAGIALVRFTNMNVREESIIESLIAAASGPTANK